MAWQKIEVNAAHPYPIFLGAPLEELGEYLGSRLGSAGHLLVICHEVVRKNFEQQLMKGLKPFRVNVITVPEGEGEKSLERLSSLTDEAMRNGADRGTVVIALGGGVIGDLAGFFASTFMRGVRFVQVPTTLLAQVDSSIGGKVGINHPAGKNLLGTFYPPVAVWTDFKTLETLPWAEAQNGLAETIKHALIGGEDFFNFLEKHHQEIINRDESVWREMVTRSLAVKVKIVSEDEKEQGIRALLNLGHSFGHALEKEMEFKGITHGQGVSIGIVAAAYLSLERGLINGLQVDRIISLLQSFNLKTMIEGMNSMTLLSHMSGDKKNKEGQKILILPKGIGQSVLVKDCTDDEIVRAWEKVIK